MSLGCLWEGSFHTLGCVTLSLVGHDRSSLTRVGLQELDSLLTPRVGRHVPIRIIPTEYCPHHGSPFFFDFGGALALFRDAVPREPAERICEFVRGSLKCELVVRVTSPVHARPLVQLLAVTAHAVD